MSIEKFASLTKRKSIFVKSILNWARDNLREFPWRERPSPYEVFIAEVLLKRTTSTAAKRVYSKFLNKYPDIHSLESAERGALERELVPIGLYRQRATGLKKAACFVHENYGGSFPDTYHELMEVPYIGSYSAGAILSLGYGKPTPMVDSNVRRVINRVFEDQLSENSNLDRIWVFLENLLPDGKVSTFNLALIDLGAIVCSYNRVLCGECPLTMVCFHFKANELGTSHKNE